MTVGIVFVLASLEAGPVPDRSPEPAPAAQLAEAELRDLPVAEPSVREQQRQARQEERRGGEEELYETGTEALDEAAWDRAASAFRSVADMKGRRADAALYWLAYSKSKQGQRAEALGILDDLRRSHPQSRWLKEANALELEIRQRSGEPARPESVADEDLKLMALNGLLHADPEQAIPLLEKFLEGQHSRKQQERALFVLCQSGSPRAREIVLRIARGEAHPDLQRKAIMQLGIFGGKESRRALDGIYAASADPGVKKAVLGAFMASGEKDGVLEIARTERDPDQRGNAIAMLGAMGARTELWAMYQAETSKEVRKASLRALGVSGATDRLLEAARSEKDVELRLEAVRLLGPFGAKTPAIMEIYRGESDRRIREAALQALFVQGNATALIEVAKTETDPELKKKAVGHLSIMRSEEATAFLLKILNN
jgi:HEAT repeat protein